MNDRYLLIGTAGHVDHGKTQLIHALTGVSTDRLKEEKERGISIELGFAHLVLPDGQKAGVVDVPGHEKFVRQMLAGASGMDIVLLVIAADEGIMPQTREHLDILTLLNIDKGIVVITKKDLVDEEWLEMIEKEIIDELKASNFKDAPICKVSSTTGDGIGELIQTIAELLQQTVSKRIDLPPRMPIDRVFTIQGFGTVVTGTLSTGIIKKGQEFSIEPGGLVARIRNIQIHGEQCTQAYAGQRVAVNLSGLAVSQVQKGSNLVLPGFFDVNQIVDVELTNLHHEKRSIKHRQRIHFHIGTAERTGRIHLLNAEELLPGSSALAQVIVDEPIVVIPGERFVIRFYSPMSTIGGGKILGSSSVKRKRFKAKSLEDLKVLANGNLKDVILRELFNPITIGELIQKTKLSLELVASIIERAEQEDLCVRVKGDGEYLYWNRHSAEQWGRLIAYTAERYIEGYPLRAGISREELKRELKQEFSARRLQYLLQWGSEQHYYKLKGSIVNTNKTVDLPENIRNNLENLREIWHKAELNPPDLMETCLQYGIHKDKALEYALYLVEKEDWINIESYFFDRSSIDDAKNVLVDFLNQKGQITVAEARDLWKTSRKYAVPILEHFDSIKITKRNDTFRSLI